MPASPVVRKSNIELMRIVLMLMIIMHHTLVHGLVFLKRVASPFFTFTANDTASLLLNCFLVISVNAFVFTSGYFGIKFKPTRILGIILQAVFYSVTLYLLSTVLFDKPYSNIQLRHAFLPLSKNLWWFITTYVWLYFTAPFLNEGIKNLSKKDVQYILLGLFILNCFSHFIYKGLGKHGYDFFNFIFLYILAQYMRKYDVSIKKPHLVWLACSVVSFLLSYWMISLHDNQNVGYVFYYNNPLIILSAVSFFFIFYNWKMGSYPWINRVAKTVLGVYMIHEYPTMRTFISNLFANMQIQQTPNVFLFIITLLGIGVAIFICASLVDLARMGLFDLVGKIGRICRILHKN